MNEFPAWNLFMTRHVINCFKLCTKQVYATSFRQFQNVRIIMLMTHKYHKITGILMYYYPKLIYWWWYNEVTWWSEKRTESSFQRFYWEKWCIVKYSKHIFKQFYCLQPLYDSFWHFGCLKLVYDKTIYTGLYHPMSETTDPAQRRNWQ